MCLLSQCLGVKNQGPAQLGPAAQSFSQGSISSQAWAHHLIQLSRLAQWVLVRFRPSSLSDSWLEGILNSLSSRPFDIHLAPKESKQERVRVSKVEVTALENLISHTDGQKAHEKILSLTNY